MGELLAYWFIYNGMVSFQGFENSEGNCFEILSPVVKANCIHLKFKTLEQHPFKSDFLTNVWSYYICATVEMLK